MLLDAILGEQEADVDTTELVMCLECIIYFRFLLTRQCWNGRMTKIVNSAYIGTGEDVICEEINSILSRYLSQLGQC